MEQRDNSFQFTYSAAQQSEIEKIRKKYLPQEPSKMDRLRQLDRSASQKATVWAIALGIMGALILGAGMSLTMTELGDLLGIYWNGFSLATPIGIAVGAVGMVLVALAYPVYNRILKKERQRIAPEILRLTDELMQ